MLVRAFPSDGFNFLKIYEMALSVERKDRNGMGDLKGQNTAHMGSRSMVSPIPIGCCKGAALFRKLVAQCWHQAHQGASPPPSAHTTEGEAYPAHFHKVCDHDDASRVFLPDHSPKVLHSLLHRTCQQKR